MIDTNSYIIEKGVLLKYSGKGGRVVIPQGVTHIKASVFEGSGIQVTSIVLPNSLQHVEKSVFWQRKSLKNIVAPSKKVYNLVYNTLNFKQKINILQQALKDRSSDPNVTSKIIANRKTIITGTIKNDDLTTVEYVFSLTKQITVELLNECIEMSEYSPNFRLYFRQIKNRLYPPDSQERKYTRQLFKDLSL